MPEQNGTWHPSRWWRAIDPEGNLWCESSDEYEVRRMARPTDQVQRLYEFVRLEWHDEPNLSAPVRSAPESRARGCCPSCAGTGMNDGDSETLGRCSDCLATGHAHDGPCAPVRVEVRPVIDATPRTPPLGHWWTTLAGLPLYDITVSTACVVDGCGLGPREHE